MSNQAEINKLASQFVRGLNPTTTKPKASKPQPEGEIFVLLSGAKRSAKFNAHWDFCLAKGIPCVEVRNRGARAEIKVDMFPTTSLELTDEASEEIHALFRANWLTTLKSGVIVGGNEVLFCDGIAADKAMEVAERVYKIACTPKNRRHTRNLPRSAVPTEELRKGRGLTKERHKEIAARLFAIRNELLNISTEVRNAYGANKKPSYRAPKAYIAVDYLRSALDGALANETLHKEWKDENLTRVYYPGNSESENSD